MKKIMTKIVGAFLGVAMTIGVGVAVNSNANPVYAAGETWASVTDTFELATSLASGDEIIIASDYAAKAMGSQGTNNRGAADITKTGTAISNKTATVATANTVALISVETTNVSGTDYFNFAVDGGYLYDASTSSKNYLRTQDDVTSNGYADWSVSFNDEGVASITARSASASNKLTMSYNTSGLFACYTGLQNNGGLVIYKRVVSTSVISSVEASVVAGTYYTGSTLSESDFSVTVKWTGGKADTNPTSNFTWTVNGVANGTLQEGDNAVVLTYEGVSSDPFNVVGTTIHATAVSIEEDSATIEVIGDTVELHGSITPSNAVETISWSSDDEGVATVDNNGLVTAVGAGSATITATAGSYSDTCEVIVYNNSKITIDFTQKDYSVAQPENAQTEPSTATIGNYTINLMNAYNSEAAKDYLMIGTKVLSTADSLVSNKTAIPGAITKVEFKTTSGASANAEYYAIVSATEITSTVSDDTNSLKGKGTLTVTANATDNLHFFAISCVTSGNNGQLESITVTYQPSTVKEDIGALDTQTSLAYRYNKDNEGKFSYSDISIRFGGYVSKDLWNELDTLYNVTGFGVMITDGENIKDYEEFTEYVENGVFASSEDSTDVVKDIVDYFVPVSKMATTIAEDGNNYFWNLRWSVDATEMDRVFSAVAYIKIGEEYVLLKKARMSVTYLAIDYMSNRGCTAETADGSLKNIVEQSSME